MPGFQPLITTSTPGEAYRRRRSSGTCSRGATEAVYFENCDIVILHDPAGKLPKASETNLARARAIDVEAI
jgi:hypothetical protein